MRSEPNYLAVQCGLGESEWLQSTNHMGELLCGLKPPPTASPRLLRAWAHTLILQLRYPMRRGHDAVGDVAKGAASGLSHRVSPN